MHANIFGELQLNCIRAPEKKTITLDPQKVTTEKVTEPFKPIKVTGVNNVYKKTGKPYYSPIAQRQSAVDLGAKPTPFENKVLLFYKTKLHKDQNLIKLQQS
jgi:hypothetical protein